MPQGNCLLHPEGWWVLLPEVPDLSSVLERIPVFLESLIRWQTSGQSGLITWFAEGLVPCAFVNETGLQRVADV
jgi:hypothetical protein